MATCALINLFVPHHVARLLFINCCSELWRVHLHCCSHSIEYIWMWVFLRKAAVEVYFMFLPHFKQLWTNTTSEKVSKIFCFHLAFCCKPIRQIANWICRICLACISASRTITPMINSRWENLALHWFSIEGAIFLEWTDCTALWLVAVAPLSARGRGHVLTRMV